jgi:hypothetical protein
VAGAAVQVLKMLNEAVQKGAPSTQPVRNTSHDRQMNDTAVAPAQASCSDLRRS